MNIRQNIGLYISLIKYSIKTHILKQKIDLKRAITKKAE